MTYADVVTQLDTMLSALSVTSPASSIKHVYTLPPKTVQVFPCWIVIPPDEIEVLRESSAMRTETPSIRCRYMNLDGGDWATAAGIAQAYREAAITKFDNVTLGGVGQLISQTFGGITLGKYGGKDVVMFDMTLRIRHQTPTAIT